ncbi:hypothetical protein PFBG_05405 [Plasmodium falciparum 7G8]|uniref:Uncharacterized protein n=1 Tax=Plasmodium falciparum (isolate 7G8) TaxID=57266 RepID=W7F763_PLAF8|nr:hypothetical protein PFBG_05405 [Plasmodium falciparum 7G8]
MLICNDGIILYVRSKCYISTRTFNRISYNAFRIQNFKTFSLLSYKLQLSLKEKKKKNRCVNY